MSEKTIHIVNCNKCEYHFVTWDYQNPKGCRFFGFKTRMIPSKYVELQSGDVCRAFKAKPK
jgi:hypothetical protein